MAAPTPPVRPATTTPVQPATTDPPVRPVATDPPARRFAPVVARRVPARRRLGNALYSAIGVVLFLFMSFPVYWMLNSSFLPTNKIRNAVPTFFPGADFTLRNYDTAIFGDHRAKFLPSL
ncbi:MAG: hypothetical protein LBS56_00060, partial [Propionibacteriaceae bacterium]|nr:hypothetical protein [Propionibacteriaceae bacterium]